MSPLVLLHGFTGSPATFDALCSALASPAPARGRNCGETRRVGDEESGRASTPEDRLRVRNADAVSSPPSLLVSPENPSARTLFSEPSAIVRPLLAGHGPDPVRVASWDAEIDRLVALLRRALDAPAHLVGYSLGGRVAYGLLARAPELFARATLIGAHPGLIEESEREARRASDARWIAVLEREGLDAFLAEWEALPLWATQAPAMIEAQRAIRRSHRAEGLAHALEALGLGAMPPVDPAAITTPLTLVAGEHDTKHRALAEAFAPRLGARVHVVPRAGHNLLVEAPDAMVELVRC